VGVVHSTRRFEPFNKDSGKDRSAARILEYVWTELYLNALIKGEYDHDIDMVIEPDEKLPHLAKGCDFIGVNYYSKERIRWADKKATHPIFQLESVPCTENCSDIGWEIYPRGLRDIVDWIYGTYRKPIIVTENGITDQKDVNRENFLTAHLLELHRAIEEDEVPVKGYLHWSLTDNYEWSRGFGPRFGLFAVDYQTKRRTATKAVGVYRRIAATNSL
jgi:beta-glucosidase/6-phospho-beta-glucosidase/beta-galactosidase